MPPTRLDAYLNEEVSVHSSLQLVRNTKQWAVANPSLCKNPSDFAAALRRRGVGEMFIPSNTTMDVSRLTGFKRWRAMTDMFATQGFLIPLDYQVRFRTVMMHTLLPLIYAEGGEWSRYRDMIMKYHLQEELYTRYATLICARQVGKSTIVANVLLALVLHVPNLEIMVISLGARQSMNLGRTLFNQMRLVMGDKMGGFVRSRTKELTVFANNTSLFLAPARGKSVRGTSISCLIADEACFMADSDAEVTVLPFTSIENVPMVFLSSPSHEENFVNRLVNYVSPVTGLPSCRTVHVQQVCRSCAADMLVACDHVKGADPPWKVGATDSHLQSALYGSSAAGNYELGGIMEIKRRPAFNPAIVAGFRDSLDQALVAPPIAAMLSIDPCGGGRHSDCAIVLLGVVEDPFGLPTAGKIRMLVLGGASVPMETASPDAAYVVIASLITAARASRHLRETTIALVVESNLSQLGAMQMVDFVAKIGDPRIVAMSETRTNSNGDRIMGPYVYLDGARGKERYVIMMDAMLRTETLRFAADMIVWSRRSNPTSQDLAQARRTFRDNIVEQLYSFSVTTTPRANGTSTKLYTGKGPNGTKKDDLAMALMMAVWQMTLYIALESYAGVRGCESIDILSVIRGTHDAIISLARDARSKDLQNNVIRRPWDPRNPDARSVARL